MRRYQLPPPMLALLALLLLASAVEASSSTGVRRWVIGGGEAPRSDGSLHMRATIGQPVVGNTNDGATRLTWGYWHPSVAPAPTDGPPTKPPTRPPTSGPSPTPSATPTWGPTTVTTPTPIDVADTIYMPSAQR
jgi:hypothetical protein